MLSASVGTMKSRLRSEDFKVIIGWNENTYWVVLFAEIELPLRNICFPWVNISRCFGSLPAILSFPYFKGYETRNTGEPLILPRSHFPSAVRQACLGVNGVNFWFSLIGCNRKTGGGGGWHSAFCEPSWWRKGEENCFSHVWNSSLSWALSI